MITDFRLFEAKDTTLFILIDKYPLSFFKDAILNGADYEISNCGENNINQKNHEEYLLNKDMKKFNI